MLSYRKSSVWSHADMELLRSYSDSEPDVDEVSTVPSSSPQEDYFGLNYSTDDEEDSTACQREKARHPLPIDTLINSYRLNEDPVGPLRMGNRETESGNVRSEDPPPSRVWRKAKRQRVEPAADLASETNYTIGCAVTSDINMFQPHPLILQSLGKPRISAVPKEVRRTLRGHASCVSALQWGLPLDVSHLLLSASMDGTVRIWNALSRRTNATAWSKKAHNGAAVKCARWCPEGCAVASGGYDKMVRVTDVETGSETFAGKHPSSVTCLKYCSNPKLMLTGTQGCVECWDTRQEGKKAVRSYQEDFQEVQDVEFLPGGNEFVCCSNFVSRDSADKAIMAWDFRTGAVLSNQIFRERYHCIQLRIHPSESCFMAQTNGNYIALFSTGRPYKMNTKKRLEGHKVEGYWTGFDVSPDGRYVFSGSADGHLHKYSFHRGHSLGSVRVSDAPCLAVASHPVLSSTVAASDWRGGVHVCH